MGTAERRNAIMKALCRRRHDTIHSVASEFDVSERTIRRDIEALSYTEPIYTQTGRYGGGVYVVDGYYMDRMYMTEDETRILNKLYKAVQTERDFLNARELCVFQGIIANYAKPTCTTNVLR